MEQLKRKLWLKRSAVAGLALATCASFTVGAFLWTPESKTALAAGGTVVSEFTETDTTVTGAPAWQNGKNNNWVVAETLDTSFNYYDYARADVYGGKAMEFVADPDDASDTVLKYWTGVSGIYLTQFTFANEVKTSEIASLTLRLYARVDTDNASKIQIFPSEVQNNDSVDAYSYSYYEYPLTAQNQWVELTLTGNDLAKIADGTFEGFVVKIQMSANAYPRDARNGAEAMQQSGYILFDSVVTEKKAPKTKLVDFTTADTTVTSAPAWENGKNGNWVTPENLDTAFNYYDYARADVYGGKAMEFVADPDDASDTVLKYWTGKSGIYLTQFTFANTIKISEISSLTLRLYARVDTDNASKIQIFPSEVQNNDSVDAYSYSYLEYPLTAQNQWVELTLTGDDLAKIADDTFEGFVVKIQMSPNAYPRDARNGAEAMQQSGYILFDSVEVQEKSPTIKVADFVDTDTTVTSAPAWENGKNNNWVTPTGLGEQIYYALYNENNEYVDTKAGVSMEFVADPDDANDTVLKYWTGVSGVYLTQFTFANEVKTSEIASLTLRLYAHVDTDNASKIQIFPSEVQNNDSVDAYSYSYYEYPLTEQNQWVELTLTGDDLAKVADDTFEGFVVKIQMSANAYPRDKRGGTAADKHSGYILFDSVTAKGKSAEEYTVTFDYNEEVSGIETTKQTLSVAPYLAKEPVAPSVLGKIFEGWYTEEGDLFDFTQPVSSNITLTAKYTDVTLAEGVLFDGRAVTLSYGNPTLVQGKDNGWYNNAIDANRLTYTESGLKFKTHIDAYYVFSAKTLGEVAIADVESISFKLYIDAVGANGNVIDIFAGDADGRFSSKKVAFNYADYMSGTAGEVTLTVSGADLEKIAVNGKFNSFNFGVLATGYNTAAVDANAPYLVIKEISYTEKTAQTVINALVNNAYMTAGASIRLNANGNGIRFETNVLAKDVAELQAWMANGAIKAVSFGTMIVPTDYLTEGETLETLRVAGKVADCVSTGFYEKVSDETTYRFWGSLVDIQAFNYTRSFIGVGYICVTDSEDNATYYYVEYDLSNARSMYSVAKAAYTSDYAWTASEKATLKAYIDGVVIINTNGQYMGGLDEAVYTPAYSVSYADGVVTITSTSEIKTVVVYMSETQIVRLTSAQLTFSNENKTVSFAYSA